MKRKRIVAVVLVIILAGYVAIFLQGKREASMLLVNGIVRTVNDAQPVAQAIAIREGHIVAVGTNDDIRSKFEANHVVDLQGKPVYPGFTDAHAHMENLGAFLINLDLIGTRSLQEIQQLVRERLAKLPEGAWLRGRGWDQNTWSTKSFPTHEQLDAIAPDVPVYLKRVDGHAIWVNKKVIDLIGVTSLTPDPEGGRIVRDAQGNPTGVFVDNAIALVDSVMPAPSGEERREALLTAVRKCVSVGLTEVHDMGVDLEEIQIYKNLIGEGRFPFRIYAAIDGIGRTWNYYQEQGPEIDRNNGKLTVRALKLYADGALGSRGAALIEPYADDPGNRGLTLTRAETIRTAADQALQRGFQLCVHAIGDRANTIVLNAYEDAMSAHAELARDCRFRIEHAQILDPSDIPRFDQLGVIPSMQPTHCTSDMYWAEDRLGKSRLAGAYAWHSLLETGATIPGGSDFPVESPNPLWGFYAAVTRQDHSGWPEDGWYPEQKMTRKEALKSFTLWAAYAAFEEDVRGSIEEGKFADLVVLSKDIMTINPLEILNTKVEMTMVGGEVAFASDSLKQKLAGARNGE